MPGGSVANVRALDIIFAIGRAYASDGPTFPSYTPKYFTKGLTVFPAISEGGTASMSRDFTTAYVLA